MGFEEDRASFIVFGLGPKVSLVPDHFSLYLPAGFADGEGIDASETFQTHPTMLFTATPARQIELNGSGKALIPISGDGDASFAFNVGLGLSPNVNRWAIRPEFGVLSYPEDEPFTQVSLGLSVRTGD